MEPKYDISIGHVPDHVQEVAEKQAAELKTQLVTVVNSVTDMLVIQRRIGECVIAAWLDGQEAGHACAEFVMAHANPDLIRHKHRSTDATNPRQLEFGRCSACDEPGTKGAACKACDGDVV